MSADAPALLAELRQALSGEPTVVTWEALLAAARAVLLVRGPLQKPLRAGALDLLRTAQPEWPEELDRKVPDSWPREWRDLVGRRVGETTTYGRYEALVPSDPLLRCLDGTQAVRLVRRYVGAARSLSSGARMRIGRRGEPDLQGGMTLELPWGRLSVEIAVEVKTPTGDLSEEQEVVRTVSARRGAVLVVARTVREAVLGLKKERERLTEIMAGTMERTLVMVKPGADREGILAALESAVMVLATSVRRLSEDDVRQLYGSVLARLVDAGRTRYAREMSEYMTGEVLVAVVAGHDAVARVRALVGPTDPRKAGFETMRGRFGEKGDAPVFRNAIHASDSDGEARRECQLLAPELLCLLPPREPPF